MPDVALKQKYLTPSVPKRTHHPGSDNDPRNYRKKHTRAGLSYRFDHSPAHKKGRAWAKAR